MTTRRRVYPHDTRRIVFEVDTTAHVEAEARCGEEETIKCEFYGFKTLVVSATGDGKRSDTSAAHTAAGYEGGGLRNGREKREGDAYRRP